MIPALALAMKRPARFAVIVYLVILHVLLILLLSGRGRSIVPLLRQQDEARKKTYFHSQMLGFHRRLDENAQPSSVLFVGDSGIQGMNLQPIRRKALNFGIGGDTTEGVLRRLSTYASLKTARAIVISIGFNDLNAGLEDRTIRNIEAILGRLPNGLPVVITSISEVRESDDQQGINARIQDLNFDLRGMVGGKANLRFIDLSELFIQRFDGRKESFLEADGIHLNLAGREAWMNAVAGELENVLGSETGKK